MIALTVEAGVKRYAPQRAALHLLQSHASVFHDFWAMDAMPVAVVKQELAAKQEDLADSGADVGGHLLGKLLRITDADNGEVAAAGRSTLDAVLRALSDCVTSLRGRRVLKTEVPGVADVLMGDSQEGWPASKSVAMKRGTEEEAKEEAKEEA